MGVFFFSLLILKLCNSKIEGVDIMFTKACVVDGYTGLKTPVQPKVQTDTPTAMKNSQCTIH